MAEGIISFKVIMPGGKEEEYYSLESFEEGLRKYPVISVRVYRDGKPIFMSNMSPHDEGYIKWVLEEVKKALEREEREQGEGE